MEFDPSKENIQPLRGGRNVSQLEVALQAQSDAELQRELLQQKGAFEEAIRTYEGDDPLDNWYNFISWVEQSYPKHGHEGNLVPLLEDCLSKFENDERYMHDRRLCKLWIKYIDLQQNPLELFQLLHSKGISVSCADLYRAWAYYYEVAGDYKRADAVFKLGLRALAQPYEELAVAHENMYMAIGREAIQGVDERRLVEQRHALTSLRTYKHNHRTVVPSVRTGNQVLHSTPGALQQNSSRPERNTNVPVTLYEDLEVAGSSIGAAGNSVSILEVARKQEVVHKENTLKPGTWKKSIITKKVSQVHVPAFKVHEDEDPLMAGGIRLPVDFAIMNHDDFSDWKTELFFPEPHDPRQIPMYPKHLVYSEPNVEFSLEEIRARKWLNKKQSTIVDTSMAMQETIMEDANIMINQTRSEIEQAVQSILLPESDNNQSNLQNFSDDRQSFVPQSRNQDFQNFSAIRQPFAGQSISENNERQSVLPDPNISQTFTATRPSVNNGRDFERQSVLSDPSLRPDSAVRQSFMQHTDRDFERSGMLDPINQSNVQFLSSTRQSFLPQNHLKITPEENPSGLSLYQSYCADFANPIVQNTTAPFTDRNTSSRNVSYFPQDQSNTSIKNYSQLQPQAVYQTKDLSDSSKVNNYNLSAEVPQKQWPNATMSSDDNYTVNMREAIKDINEIWKDDSSLQEPVVEVQKPVIRQFFIHEDTKIQDESDNRPVCSVPRLKTTPFTIANDPDEQAQENASGETKQLERNKLHFSIYEDDGIPNQRTSNQNRKSLRAPFSSQPLPEEDLQDFKKHASYSEPFSDENFVRPAEIKKITVFEDVPAFNDSCNTQMFNFNLKSVQASTPCNVKKNAIQFHNEQQDLTHKPSSKKVLFDENQETQQEETCNDEKLSVILENSKEYRYSSSSSSGGATTLKVTTFHRESLKVIPEATCTQDESILNNDFHKTSDDDVEKSTINNYKMLKMLLRDNFTSDNRQSFLPSGHFSPAKQSRQIIDLTDDDSLEFNRNNLISFSESGGGDSVQAKQQFNASNLQSYINNYESPVKNQFRAMSCDSSNDSMSNSPVKGAKMDVDFNSLSSQNSNSESRMDHETPDAIPVPFDPFASQLIANLLTKVGFPNPKYSRQYIQLQHLPRLVGKKEVVTFLDEKYLVEKVIGKGAFGSVFKAVNVSTNQLMALKYQKPANKWEYYITKEIRERLSNPFMLSAYMDVTACYTSPTASVLISEFFKLGSLLDLTNKLKQVTGKGLKELMAIYYANEIITIVNGLHKCGIIHADIKPDNFLVTRIPPDFGHPSLQLIDFGCSIDMTLFPEGTTFNKVISTENFICTEMKDGRPWTYQTDIFCVAATVHVLLFDKYMQVQKSGNVWSISQHIPRYLRTDLWKTFFFQMLNIESCDTLPDLNAIKSSFESIISAQSEELQMEMRFVSNNVLGR